MGNNRQRYKTQFRPAYSRLHEDRDLRWVVPFAVRYVIVIVGERFAGKSAALSYLSETRGFRSYSLTDELRNEASQRGLPLEPRAALRGLGNEVRADAADRALLARLTLRRIHADHLLGQWRGNPTQRIAVGGFKRPEELRLFQGLGGSCLIISVRAEEAKRYARSRTSGVLKRELQDVYDRKGKPVAVTKRSFARYVDRPDLQGTRDRWTDGYGQAVQELLNMWTPAEIYNNDSLGALYSKLDVHVDAMDRRHRTTN